MRRKSERTSGKKSKISPEKKIEKVKRTKTRRKKQSTSSDNDSPDEVESPREEVAIDNEKKPPSTPVKEDSPEEAQDQVWRVKAPETGDSGEIKKLKICLTRPPSTPERAERSPRSKRKHSRATSSSDAASGDAGEERKRSKHRSKRAHRDSKDESDKNQDSHGEDQEADNETHQSIDAQENENEVTQSENDQPQNTEATISTTNEENQSNESGESNEASEEAAKETECKSDADTTVASPKSEAAGSPQHETPLADNVDQSSTKDKLVDHDGSAMEEKDKSMENSVGKLDHSISEQDCRVIQDAVTEEQGDFNKNGNSNEMQENTVEKVDNSTNKEDISKEKQDNSIEKCDKTNESQTDTSVQDALIHDQSESLDKSEILELHPEESRNEMSDLETSKHADSEAKEELRGDQEPPEEVSISRETGVCNDQDAGKNEKVKDNYESGVVENENDEKELRKPLADSEHDKDTEKSEVHKEPLEIERQNSGGSDTVTTPTAQENIPLNGQAPTTVVSRKRRWGSRPKITTQKSITISTEVLKDIIPDVKPVAFDEVIEEKKHRRVEVAEKVQRPLLPKIVIDNTENVEQSRKEIDAEDKDKDSIKSKEHHLASNRKISIVKENDNKLARPPSPPKHKQSSILYITNLVRPFTLPQLKNLLQRTGKIMENGFWIDRIKSKCFVQYETEDQAVETRHALHGVKWPVSNPKTLHVDFSTQDAFDKAKSNEDADNAQVSTIPGTVEDWLREQDQKRERVDMEKQWDRKASMREWDVGKNEKDKEREKVRREERPIEKRRHRSQERSPEPARKFKKKEEEAPAKLLDDLFRKTKTTPCIYWLPLSAETIAIKEEQRRQHMAEYERRMQEQRRPHRRH